MIQNGYQMSKSPRDRNKHALKVGGLITCTALAISIGFISFAADGETGANPENTTNLIFGNTPLSSGSNISVIASGNFALNSAENADLLAEAKSEAEQAVNQSTTECADPNNPGGLGGVQKSEMENERKRDLSKVDLDKIFQIGKKNGCFNALNDFPDLSANIPTLSGIFDSVKKTLISYATRKVCAVVDEALEGALGPIQEKMDEVSDRGMLDLSGRVNKEILKRMYEIDPELGRVSKSSKPAQEVEFKW